MTDAEKRYVEEFILRFQKRYNKAASDEGDVGFDEVCDHLNDFIEETRKDLDQLAHKLRLFGMKK